MMNQLHIDLSNKEYAKQERFIKLCELANVKPTPRQASKFRRKLGKVYKLHTQGYQK